MKIIHRTIDPSREDAVRLTRNEKVSMIVLAYACTILEDLQKEIPDRLNMIPDGLNRVKEISDRANGVLDELRLTIPMNQRMNLSNTAQDYEFRLAPKATPQTTTVIMTKDEFRDLVDYARIRCRECTDDDDECGKCGLYQLLTEVLPLEDYHDTNLCPYNMGEWAN